MNTTKERENIMKYADEIIKYNQHISCGKNICKFKSMDKPVVHSDLKENYLLDFFISSNQVTQLSQKNSFSVKNSIYTFIRIKV